MKAAPAVLDPYSRLLAIKRERAHLVEEHRIGESELAKIAVSERRKALAGQHPILFGRIYFPQWFAEETPAFHWEIVHGYMTFRRYAVAAPVGSAKTTILTKVCSLWSLFCERINGQPVNDILLVSSAQDVASLFLDDMGTKVRASDELREDFGEFCGSHWGSDTLEFLLPDGAGGTRRAFIRTLGRGGALRGRRPDRIVLDDPEDEKSVKSDAQRTEFSTWFWGALVNRLTKDKFLTYIGTCMTPETFLVRLINTPPDGWTIRSFRMWDEERQESLWPSQWPAALLMQRRKEIGERAFAAEFQNEPVSHWHQLLFDMSQVVIQERSVTDEDWVSVCVDPSYAVGGDPWAVTMVAVDRVGTWHLVEAIKMKTGTSGWLMALLELRQKYPRIHALAVEAGGGQKANDYIVTDWMRQHGIGFPMVQYLTHSHTNGAKTARIANLTNIINSGRFHMRPGMAVAYSDIKSYRAGLDKQDDHLCDSLAMHLEAQRARTPTEAIALTPDEIRHKRFVALRKMITAGKPTVETGRLQRYL